MTNEDKSKAIAESCGWTKVGRSLAGLGGFPPAGYENNPLPSSHGHSEDWRIRYGQAPGNQWFPLPDYLKDLNAMHEAEKVLTFDQQTEYIGWLARMNKDKYFNFGLAHMSASQRAEAFGKTLNLW